jgi:branched-chain amino acid transport system permease protein
MTTRMDPMLPDILQQVANGLALGSVYALIAVGFTMVYGILFFINLPHGDMMMVGTYVVLACLLLRMPFMLAVLAGLAFSAILGVTTEFFAYRRLRRARRLAPLLSAVGLSYVFANSIQVAAGPAPRRFETPVSGTVSLGPVTLPTSVIVIVATTAAIAIALEYFVNRTRLGTAIRAASQDLSAASLMGVNVNMIISLTFGISGMLAVAGGIMIGLRYGTVSPNIGFAFMLKAFAACVLGGIGKIRGAIIGGVVLGLAEVIAVAFVSSAYRDAIAFAILIATLLIRPTGILGGRSEVAV